MPHPSDWIFKRIKIEDNLFDSIERLANLRGDQKADIIAETVEWLVKNREEGSIPPRYFASTENAHYKNFWVKPDTIRSIEDLAKADNQNPNRVIYTAIARFIEKDKN
ncbi:hypothetical protein IF821_22985 [Citrobacter freundii]|uniref:hypothetical protein n=1 Tax=Citrobacter freundii TaxID=546 RepID=UPI00177EE553|nr:hypothetical protein [Citrobacter freundii]MBD5760113.1 hypothetical protein [Citrobacter freundii]